MLNKIIPVVLVVFGALFLVFNVKWIWDLIGFRKKGAVSEEFTVADDDMQDVKQPLTHLIRKAKPEQDFMVDLGSKTVKPRDTVKMLYLEGEKPMHPKLGQYVSNLLLGVAMIVLGVMEMAGFIRVL